MKITKEEMFRQMRANPFLAEEEVDKFQTVLQKLNQQLDEDIEPTVIKAFLMIQSSSEIEFSDKELAEVWSMFIEGVKGMIPFARNRQQRHRLIQGMIDVYQALFPGDVSA